MKVNHSLAVLQGALETYWRIMCGQPEPNVIGILRDWNEKKEELLEVSRLISFDLVELAKIIASAKSKIHKVFGRRQLSKRPLILTPLDPIHHTAMYLRSRGGPALGPQVVDLYSDQYLMAAKEAGNTEFFIMLGQHLQGHRPKRGLNVQIDKLKMFFVVHWEPRTWFWRDESGNLKKGFWPGLAYMTNPLREQLFAVFNPSIGPHLSTFAFTKTRQRLGLLPASNPLFKNAIIREGSIFFA